MHSRVRFPAQVRRKGPKVVARVDVLEVLDLVDVLVDEGHRAYAVLHSWNITWVRGPSPARIAT